MAISVATDPIIIEVFAPSVLNATIPETFTLDNSTRALLTFEIPAATLSMSMFATAAMSKLLEAFSS